LSSRSERQSDAPAPLERGVDIVGKPGLVAELERRSVVVGKKLQKR
jgi:hypothetical protein